MHRFFKIEYVYETLRVVTLILFACVLGCEAPLRLEGVEQRRNEPIRRTDQFQAAAGNKDSIVVVGNQGLILTSFDEGQKWHRSKLPGWPSLIDVTACANGLFAALAMNGQVWISNDNSQQWQAYALDTQEAPQAITCDPQNRLWVVGSFSSILSSNDAGKSWTLNSLEEDIILTNIQFLDAQNAFISGEFGTLLRSSDAGESWEMMPELENEFYPHSMFYSDTQNAWVVGLGGEIMHSRDGGSSWELQKSGSIAPLYGIEQAGNGLYVVGGEGLVLQYRNNQWTKLNHGKPFRMYLRATLALGNNRLLVAGGSGSLHILSLNNL